MGRRFKAMMARRPEEYGIGLQEMQSLDGEFESQSSMRSLHRTSFASACDSNRKTVPSPRLPLSLSSGNTARERAAEIPAALKPKR
jgi:hypothetical protein